MALIKLNGKPVNTLGDFPEVGSQAPDFELVNTALKTVTLEKFTGKKKVLNIVASVDTRVCADISRKWHSFAEENPDTAFLTISTDLPFALDRFRRDEKHKRISYLSLMRSKKFAKDYGVLLVDGPLQGVMARALLVLDENNRILYAELVEDITHEPDYEQALVKLLN